MILRLAAALSLAFGAAALLIYSDVMGHGPVAGEAARHLRAMKDRRAAPDSVTSVTLDDIAALPHRAPPAEVGALERRGAAIEGYIQRMLRAGDDDYHLEVVITPRRSGGPDTTYAAAEITPAVRGASPRWTYDGLIAAFRPNHGGRTAWDAGPRRVRVSGWLLYDFQYDVIPSEWQKQMGAPRISGWEIHPVTRIELWDDALGRYLDYPR